MFKHKKNLWVLPAGFNLSKSLCRILLSNRSCSCSISNSRISYNRVRVSNCCDRIAVRSRSLLSCFVTTRCKRHSHYSYKNKN